MSSLVTAGVSCDPVLAQHRVSNRQFELSGLRTGSIRDQMLRARIVVERLIQHKFLVRGGRALLVLGGGVAGVVATLTAAREGIDVVLLEREEGPFRTQRESTRRLDPTEYDWPHPHWVNQVPLWPQKEMPLFYSADTAEQLAFDWERAFFAWTDAQYNTPTPGHGEIEYYWGVDASELYIRDYESVTDDYVEVTNPSFGASRDRFAAAISCIGFSGEKVSVPSNRGTFEGYRFWSRDVLEERDMYEDVGMLTEFKVLVSGGGDGAQQDFQRVLTGKFGRGLHDAFEPYLPSLDLLKAVLSEDAARRAFAWRRDGAYLGTALRQWHEAFLKVVEDVWTVWVDRDLHFKGYLANIAHKILIRPSVRCTWVVGGATPDFGYALNRFLALLLARLHAHQTGRSFITELAAGKTAIGGNDVIVLGQWLQRVEVPAGALEKDASGPHQCGDASRCFGVPHEVFVADEMKPKAGHPQHPLGTYHAVIVRHGVDQRPLFFRPPIAEQIVPFNLPV